MAFFFCNDKLHRVESKIQPKPPTQERHKKLLAETLLVDPRKYATNKNSSYLVEKLLSYCSPNLWMIFKNASFQALVFARIEQSNLLDWLFERGLSCSSCCCCCCCFCGRFASILHVFLVSLVKLPFTSLESTLSGLNKMFSLPSWVNQRWFST